MNFRFQLRNRADANGLCCIYILINYHKRIWVPSGIKVLPQLWHQDKQELHRTVPLPVQKKFNELKFAAEQYRQTIEFENKEFTLRDFKMAITGHVDQLSNPTLAFLISEYISNKQISYERAKHYQAFERELHTLHPAVRIKSINYAFATKLYKYYTSNFSSNTATRKMKQLKALIHYAEDLCIIKADPLKAVKLKSFTSKKIFLTIAELEVLQDLYDSSTLSPQQQNILRHFLFACYTGMRISDIKKFNISNVKGNCIYFIQQKTKEAVIIPLNTFSKKLLQQPFNITSGQYINRELATIATMANIQKHITMHVGRHTFATVSLRLGMELTAVSKILGHKTIKETQGYLHLSEDHLQEQMNVWNKLTVAHKQIAV